METAEMYDIFQTCLLGESIRAAGLSYNVEDNLHVYHIDDVVEQLKDEGVNGEYYTPTQYLEYKCGTNIKRIIETIYVMEASWKKGRNLIQKNWMIPIAHILWGIGKDVAGEYIFDMFEADDMSDFAETGDFLFRM